MKIKTKKTIFVIILIGISLIVIAKLGGLFAILPSGQYNAYPDKINCIFITNVDPANSRYSSYSLSTSWIAIDYNGDGIKEKFGKYGSSSGTGRVGGCGGSSNSRILVSDYNSYGDDVYYYSYSGDRIYVCSPDGKQSQYFKKDYGSASNAITTCVSQPSPSPVCSEGIVRLCLNGEQVCKNGVWGSCQPVQSYVYKTSYSCDSFIGGEYQKGNFNGFCWSNTKSILNIYDRKLYDSTSGCVIEYINGCENIRIKQNTPQLLLGGGNNKKINIVIFSYNFNNSILPAFLYLSNNIVNTMKITKPFSDNLDKFNVYRVINGSSIGNQQNFISQGIYTDSYDSYLPRVSDGIFNKPEDIIFLVDMSIWGFGVVGYGGRRSANGCMSVGGINGINYYGNFCPAIAQTKGLNNVLIMHEIGHTFGLDHNFSTNNFMSYSLSSDHFEQYQIQKIVSELGKF